jgi:hypothetical protein
MALADAARRHPQRSGVGRVCAGDVAGEKVDVAFEVVQARDIGMLGIRRVRIDSA